MVTPAAVGAVRVLLLPPALLVALSGCGTADPGPTGPALTSPSSTTRPAPVSPVDRFQACIDQAADAGTPAAVQQALTQCQDQYTQDVRPRSSGRDAIAALQACLDQARNASTPAAVQQQLTQCQDQYALSLSGAGR